MSYPDEFQQRSGAPREPVAEPPAATGDGRLPWRRPELTRLPMSETLLGGSVGNEGNGAFAFSQFP
jgi:hypothetical protein